MKKEKVINSSALWKKLSDYVRKAGRVSARDSLDVPGDEESEDVEKG